MAIQLNTPVLFVFRFRHLDENGTDLGPLDLSVAAHLPIVIKVLRPKKTTSDDIPNAEVSIVDAANGLVEWDAGADDIDVVGTWKAQAHAGEYKSRIVAFSVQGPNL